MDEISVVTCESKIVRKARSYPAASAPRNDLPLADSSRIRSKIRTLASTAIPIVRSTPAMPGRVRVVPMEHMTPSRMMIFVSSAISATKPAKR